MRTIAVMNQKGGCGKTTVSINLAGALAALDRRVLLIDLDPQAHASVGLGIRQDAEVTSYELLMDPATRIDAARIKVNEHLDLIASSTVLSGVEQELSERMGREEQLSRKLSDLGLSLGMDLSQRSIAPEEPDEPMPENPQMAEEPAGMNN